ncbi:MBL fold metallo-hydrolase RNA specificity domain-containing protein [Streptomyces sp. CG1]|uniref:MBL fold metallo-hydrolase RNA specificity domain-containing protein n=1 Tax=Streptomyces sp. CG1 TaxID=1287523 RepID=UPI0034E22015
MQRWTCWSRVSRTRSSGTGPLRHAEPRTRPRHSSTGRAIHFSRIRIARCTAAGRFSASPTGPSRHYQHITATDGAPVPFGLRAAAHTWSQRHDHRGHRPRSPAARPLTADAAHAPRRCGYGHRQQVPAVPHFSAHADAGQIIEWLRGAPAPHTTYLVHGEPDEAAALRDRVDRQPGWTAVVPRSREHVLEGRSATGTDPYGPPHRFRTERSWVCR